MSRNRWQHSIPRSASSLGILLSLVVCILFLIDLCAAPAPKESEGTVSHEDYTESLPKSKVTFDMVAIRGGQFTMGSPNDEKGRGPDEGPRRLVRIRPFWMGKCEVTWDEFDRFFHDGEWASTYGNEEALKKNADAITRPTPPYVDETWGFGREGYPVVAVSHHAAMEYCYWLSKMTGHKYRLPTEAEWEYTCRAGTQTPYFFGDGGEVLGDYAWFSTNAQETTHPVGLKKPNPWGLHDMTGNVAEWCLDHYQADIYGTYPADRPPLGPVLLPTEKRYPHAVRGGSWNAPPMACRSAARLSSDKKWNRLDPERPQSVWWLSAADFVGFRVVRAVEEQENLTRLRSKVTRQSQ